MDWHHNLHHIIWIENIYLRTVKQIIKNIREHCTIRNDKFYKGFQHRWRYCDNDIPLLIPTRNRYLAVYLVTYGTVLFLWLFGNAISTYWTFIFSAYNQGNCLVYVLQTSLSRVQFHISVSIHINEVSEWSGDFGNKNSVKAFNQQFFRSVTSASQAL